MRNATLLWTRRALCVATVGLSLILVNSLSRSLLLPLMQADQAAAAKGARASPRIAEDGDRSIDLVLLLVVSCAVGSAVPGLFTLTAMCSGYVLGTFVGAIAATLGTLSGVAACFALARRCFHDAAASFVEARLPSAHAIAQRPTAKAVATSWFLPVPMAVKVLFWASCSVIPWPRFIGAASVVVVPHVVILAWVGDQARRLRDHAERRDGAIDATEVLAIFGIAGGVVAAYVAVSAWVRRRATSGLITAAATSAPSICGGSGGGGVATTSGSIAAAVGQTSSSCGVASLTPTPLLGGATATSAFTLIAVGANSPTGSGVMDCSDE